MIPYWKLITARTLMIPVYISTKVFWWATGVIMDDKRRTYSKENGGV